MTDASGPTLVEWLRPLIVARKATAEAANPADSGVWSIGNHYGIVADADGEVVVYDEGSPTEEQAEHIALNDPRDVIARCDFELGLLDTHAYDPMNGCRRCADGIRWVRSQPLVNPVDYPCATVRLLGSAYRHFDGYREEWA